MRLASGEFSQLDVMKLKEIEQRNTQVWFPQAKSSVKTVAVWKQVEVEQRKRNRLLQGLVWLATLELFAKELGSIEDGSCRRTDAAKGRRPELR